jgi:hypothetical protein
VTETAAEAAAGNGITFGEIGHVELKGVSGTVHLLRAHLDE